MATLHTTPPTTSANGGANGHNVMGHASERGTLIAPSNGNSALEITYSTISPKIEQPSPYPMMNIKLNLIDQNAMSSNITTPNGGMASCESPFPMTPLTPGGSADMSKKQRHNLREQRRILRISNQFDILRAKLEMAGYSSSKKDKHSVLQATLEYINALERNQVEPRANGGITSTTTSTNATSTSTSTPSAPPSTSPSNTSRLSITAPPPVIDNKQQQSVQPMFMIDSMPSPVPALSMPTMQFPMNPMTSMNPMEQTMGYPGTPGSQSTPHFPVEWCVDGSTASYKDVFANSSMPSLLSKLDGTIVEANSLFLELCCKNIDELRLHSLYTMCTAMDAPKMYNLVNKILSCEMASAQSKMMWHFANTGDRKVFVSVSMIHDKMHQPANLHCSLLPLS